MANFIALNLFSKCLLLWFLTDAEQIRELDLWGDYAIPQDNFYSEDKKIEHKIWALGLGNPWHCRFDSQRILFT